MQSKTLIVILLAVMLLGACQPAQTAQVGEPTSGTQVKAPEATAEPTEANQPTVASGEPMAGCRVTGSKLKPDPTMEALFPAVSEKDWVTGPRDATVTVIEYSDFQ